MRRILRLLNLRDESGAVLVIVAISMVALLGVTALAIDGGRLYSEKSKLQKALDAAVLAGAQGLTSGEAQAIEIAQEVSQKNGFPLTEDDLSLTSDSIRATKQINVPLTFARVLGMNNTDVNAKAKAIIAPLKKGYGIAPIAVDYNSVPDVTELNCGNTGAHHGNCGFLDIDGNGADGLADGIKNGTTFEIGTEIAETEPGGKVGPVQDAIQYLIDSDKDKPQCQSLSTADNSCARLITIVVIDTWENADGKSTVKVVGLAAYWIEKLEGKRIIGHFKDWVVASGETGSGTEIGDYNLFGVKLVE
ncbi:pilus assembly protein TadG-related protein [Bacillaceae bacterium C204]|uniref:pilus assembly protein TadG-related protein n=1 Tax=Neobacillus sp. 204 TaxID=3383351 RepID=UPI00397B10F9